jgi:hypothetical protein
MGADEGLPRFDMAAAGDGQSARVSPGSVLIGGRARVLAALRTRMPLVS